MHHLIPTRTENERSRRSRQAATTADPQIYAIDAPPPVRKPTRPSLVWRARPSLRFAQAMVLALLMLSWGAPAAAPSVEQQLDALRQEDLRVATIAYRLAAAGGDLCPAGGRLTGLLVHDRAQYAPAFRAAAVRLFGLGDGPTVEAVVPGSPADAAGLQAGDALIAVNEAPLGRSSRPSLSAADNTEMEQMEALLDEAAAAGTVTMQVRRGAALLTLALVPRPGCAGRVQLVPSNALDAGTDGTRISLTTRLVERVGDDDELAMLIAHEMAHVARNDPAILAPIHARRGRLSRSDAAAIRATEVAADRLGARLSIRAGYTAERGALVWQRLAAGRVRLNGDPTHPDWRERLRIARETASNMPPTGP